MAQNSPTTNPGQWRTAQITEIIPETPRVKSFRLLVQGFTKFRAGQHLDIRLTAPDGYQARRSYSIASPPEEQNNIQLLVERMPQGEVSPFMHDVLQLGDEIEVRGPIGGPFTWTVNLEGSVLLVAGGSGIAPIMSMIRHAKLAGTESKVVLLYSSRTHQDIIFYDELTHLASNTSPRFDFRVTHTLTRSHTTDWQGRVGRIGPQLLEEVITELGVYSNIRAYVCGATQFAETIADTVVKAGVSWNQVAVERFGG